MPEHESLSPWSRFWQKGGWWKAVIVAAVYLAVYLGIGWVVGQVFPPGGGVRGEKNSALDIFIGTGLPILLISILLLIFAFASGLFRDLFGPQPIKGRPWMWIGVAVPLAIVICALFGINWASVPVSVVFAWLATGLLVGFAEEIVTRGFVVTLMRKPGHPEIAVAAVSAGIFAALHASNLLGGAALLTTGIQLLYTFGFGICMYLVMRVTGSLVSAMLVHAATDPIISLYALYPTGGIVGLVVATQTWIIFITGVVLLFFIRGRVKQSEALTN